MSVPHSASMTRMMAAPSTATKSSRFVGTVTAAHLRGSEPRFGGAERRTQKKVIGLARSSFSAHRPRVASSSTRRIREDMDGPTVSTAAAMAAAEDDDGSIDEDVRGAPEEMPSAVSVFASMFAAATDEVNDDQKDEAEECCDPADEECVDSPFCSITYVDDSGDDDGEDIFLPPMMDPRGGGGGGGGGGGTATGTSRRQAPHPPAPTAPLHATIEVCMGKACARAGAQEVLDTVCAGLPNGWNAQPGRKCMGMCKRACVVRVTSDADQVVHTNVTPTTAAITVLPGRSYPAFPSFVGLEPSSPAAASSAAATRAAREKEQEKEKDRIRVPAAAGLFAAAAAGVESGVALNTSPSDEESTGEEGNEEGVSGRVGKKKKKKSSSSAVLRAARMASQRIGAMDIEAYNADKMDRRRRR